MEARARIPTAAIVEQFSRHACAGHAVTLLLLQVHCRDSIVLFALHLCTKQVAGVENYSGKVGINWYCCRYAKFLLLRKHHLELQHPIPPLDIALMWSSHMSASGLYAADCQQLLQRSFSDMPGAFVCLVVFVEGGGQEGGASTFAVQGSSDLVALPLGHCAHVVKPRQRQRAVCSGLPATAAAQLLIYARYVLLVTEWRGKMAPASQLIAAKRTSAKRRRASAPTSSSTKWCGAHTVHEQR